MKFIVVSQRRKERHEQKNSAWEAQSEGPTSGRVSRPPVEYIWGGSGQFSRAVPLGSGCGGSLGKNVLKHGGFEDNSDGCAAWMDHMRQRPEA